MAGRFAAVLLEPGWEPVDEQVEGLLGPFTALLRVKPYKCYLRPDEIEDVADEYDLPADNLQALADRSKLKKSTG